MPLFFDRQHGEQVYQRYCALVFLGERRDKSVVLNMYRRVADPYKVADDDFWRWAAHVDDAALHEVQRRLLSVESVATYRGEREP